MSAPPAPAPPGSRAIDIRDLEFGWARGEPQLMIDRLQIAPGERVFVTGSSGSGKSTLLGLIAGVLSPRAGEVRVAGTTIHALAPGARDRFRGAHIGFIFQMFNLIPYLDVLANVLAQAGMQIAELNAHLELVPRKDSDRRAIRARVEERFAPARMVEAYLDAYALVLEPLDATRV